MYQYRTLEKESIQQIAECFNLAFSDYEQPICFTPESLKYYLTASRVDLSLSFGAFFKEELVGIILNSYGIYNNEPAVFDAGAGVIPDHRSKKVFSNLLNYTCRQLQAKNIKKYYLEVLQSNNHAVSIYQMKGFSIQREYSVLTASGAVRSIHPDITTVPYQDFNVFPTTFSTKPSFEHTLHAVNQNPHLYEVLTLNNLAYCIFAKRNGEIIQMHYNELNALKEVMIALTDRFPSAMAKNVDYRYSDVIQMLTEIGFKEITNQYEMARDI